MEESAASIGVEEVEEILVLDETLSQPQAVFLAEGFEFVPRLRSGESVL
jgi:hypothetical protein